MERQLLRPSRAETGGFVRGLLFLDGGVRHLCPGGGSQLCQLLQRYGGVKLPRVHADEQRSLLPLVFGLMQLLCHAFVSFFDLYSLLYHSFHGYSTPDTAAKDLSGHGGGCMLYFFIKWEGNSYVRTNFGDQRP